MADKVMIIGYGSTGKYALDMLTRLPEREATAANMEKAVLFLADAVSKAAREV